MASGGLILFPTIASASNSGLGTENKLSHHTDIRKNIFGKQIEITGQIFDASGKNTLNGAQLEFWHQSPNTDIVGHRGSLITDENGRYQLKSDYPSRELGTATTVHFKVTKGGSQYVTELTVSDFDAFISSKHWEENHQLGEALLFPKREQQDLKTKVNFNISVNI